MFNFSPKWTFWQNMDILSHLVAILADIRHLAQMLQLQGCKRKVRVQATYTTLQTLFN